MDELGGTDPLLILIFSGDMTGMAGAKIWLAELPAIKSSGLFFIGEITTSGDRKIRFPPLTSRRTLHYQQNRWILASGSW